MSEKFYERLVLLCLASIVVVVVVGILTTPGPITARAAPVSWETVPATSGNFSWLVLGPAFIPYAFGSPARCIVTVEIDGVQVRSSVDPGLCETQPKTLEVTYRQPDGPGSKRIFLDEVRASGNS